MWSPGLVAGKGCWAAPEREFGDLRVLRGWCRSQGAVIGRTPRSRRVGIENRTVGRVLQAGRQNATLGDSRNKMSRDVQQLHAGGCGQSGRSRQARQVPNVKRDLSELLVWWLSQNSTAVDVCVSAVFLKRCGAHSLVSVSRGEYWLTFPSCLAKGRAPRRMSSGAQITKSSEDVLGDKYNSYSFAGPG